MNASLVQSSPEEKKKVTGKLEDTLYCAKVGHITIFIVLSVWNEMIAVSSLLTKTSSASLKSKSPGIIMINLDCSMRGSTRSLTERSAVSSASRGGATRTKPSMLPR